MVEGGDYIVPEGTPSFVVMGTCWEFGLPQIIKLETRMNKIHRISDPHVCRDGDGDLSIEWLIFDENGKETDRLGFWVGANIHNSKESAGWFWVGDNIKNIPDSYGYLNEVSLKELRAFLSSWNGS